MWCKFYRNNGVVDLQWVDQVLPYWRLLDWSGRPSSLSFSDDPPPATIPVITFELVRRRGVPPFYQETP